MKYQSKLGERGQVVIPKPIRDNLRLAKNSAIEFEVKGAVVTLRPKRPEDEMANFDLAMKKYAGSLRKRFLASGYKSVDDYIDDIRGRGPGTHD
ncbi:MAG TPA: AbrB/MazE/SpoVT family DNA-binding domain-containing protein [Acidobacteriaceae bacterium]